MNALLDTFDKGYPEYNPGQPRDQLGRWGGGGGYAAVGRVVGGKSLREVPRLISRQGATRAEFAIKQGMTTIPEAHYNMIKNLRFFAIRDSRKMHEGKKGALLGFFMPLLGVVIPEQFNGMILKNLAGTVVHELAHVLDYRAKWALSEQLLPTMTEEMAALPKAQKFYAEHYAADAHGKEWFAELYRARYGPTKDNAGDYFGSMTRAQVRKAFPKSLAALVDMDFTGTRKPILPRSWRWW